MSSKKFKWPKFLFELVLILLLSLFPLFLILFSADGTTDNFYVRYTTPAQNSLILGDSRSAQAIQPKIINENLNRNDLFNFSFTNYHSPFGPIYLSAIKKKLKSNLNDPIFIICVSPWSVSSITQDPNDIENFRENSMGLGKINNINRSPNFEYLFKVYDESFIRIPINKFSNDNLLHQDGWLEINITMDDQARIKRTNQKVKLYQDELLPNYKFSDSRWNHLRQTIQYLDSIGTVYVLRLPISHRILKIEEKLNPQFSKHLQTLCDSFEIPYWDMTVQNTDYRFTDGNHLHKSSGTLVSKKIADWIQTQSAKR